MKIIIVGAGEVGYHIAEKLSREGHEVAIVEQESSRYQQLRETMDAQVIFGSGASTEILDQAGISKCDLFIAVTASDEANIIACLLAHKFHVPRIIGRVSASDFIGKGKIDQKELGIDLLINPQSVVAMEICKLVGYSEASDAAEFANGKVVFLGHPIEIDSPLAGLSLKLLGDIRGVYRLVVTAISRSGNTLIPRGNDTIEAGDTVYFVCKKKDLPSIRYLFGDKDQIKRKSVVFVLGGGRVGFEVAQELSKQHYSVRVIERSADRAHYLAESLDGVRVLNTDATDVGTFREEGMERADVFISVTDDDKTNIIAALLAKQNGAKRSIVLVNQPDLLALAPSLGIDVCISPRMATASAVLKHIKRGKVLEMATVEQSQSEVMELLVPEKHAVNGKSLREIEIPEGANIGAIVRGEEVVIPDGDDVIHGNDHLIVFSLPAAVASVERFFS